MSTVGDFTTTFLTVATERRCDQLIRGGRRIGKSCDAPATHYDSAFRRNLCGTHARFCDRARLGIGAAWYEDSCNTHGHEMRPVRAIGADGVRRCGTCSFDYELAISRADRALPVAA